MDDVKQVIILRKDLNMRKGKHVAQGSHASISALLKLFNHTDTLDSQVWSLTVLKKSPLYYWLNGSFTKVVLSVDSLEELEVLEQKAIELNILTAKIIDEGRTEFNGIPTITALAIGPDETSKIDIITKHLKLL